MRYQFKLGETRRHFLHEPWAGGVVLLACVIIALLLANMPWTADAYHNFLTTKLSLNIESHNGFSVTYPENLTVEKFINDALMVIFFFGVGLEIKREVVSGQLSSFKKAILPVVAAVGGMLVPAFIYSIFNAGAPEAGGWGIPMATDIAFAIGIMSILGDKVPVSLKIFLTALAIADDLGAIIVIAVFYGGTVNFVYLAVAVAIMALIYWMGRMGERRMMYYIIPAIVMWSLFYYSGVHATLSGVIMAMLVPTKPRYSKQYLLRQADQIEEDIVKAARSEDESEEEHYHAQLNHMSKLTYGSVGMSHKLEEALSPYITFVILPIFALANAGVVISAEDLNIFAPSAGGGNIGLGIIFGLLIGKPVGIFITSWLAVKCKLAAMPSNTNWLMLFAVACLGGIGFTMSIFVDTLAFSGDTAIFINQGKLAILFGSFASAILGIILINIFSKKN